MLAVAMTTGRAIAPPIRQELVLADEPLDWDREVIRIGRDILASRAEFLADIAGPRRRLLEMRDQQRADLEEARDQVRARRGQAPLDELHEELVARAVEIDEERAEATRTRLAEEAAAPLRPGTRSEPCPSSPSEIPIADVRAALERGFRLLATVGREASPMGGQIEALKVGVLEDIEQSVLRKSLEFEKMAVEREAWAAFFAHRLTAEERHVLGLVARRGMGIISAASVLRISEHQAERRLTMAYAKVRVFIFDSDGK